MKPYLSICGFIKVVRLAISINMKPGNTESQHVRHTAHASSRGPPEECLLLKNKISKCVVKLWRTISVLASHSDTDRLFVK